MEKDSIHGSPIYDLAGNLIGHVVDVKTFDPGEMPQWLLDALEAVVKRPNHLDFGED